LVQRNWRVRTSVSRRPPRPSSKPLFLSLHFGFRFEPGVHFFAPVFPDCTLNVPAPAPSTRSQRLYLTYCHQ
jgi:hypothetical protein